VSFGDVRGEKGDALMRFGKEANLHTECLERQDSHLAQIVNDISQSETLALDNNDIDPRLFQLPSIGSRVKLR